jgi:hypothetical protein
MLAQRLDRPFEALDSVGPVGPHERLQEQRTVVGGHVDGLEIDSDAVADRQLSIQQVASHPPSFLTLQLEPSVRRPPLPGLVLVAVPVPEEEQSGAGAELDQVDRRGVQPTCRFEKAGQQRPAPLHLVRLHALLGHEAAQELAFLHEHIRRAVPGCTAGEHQVVEPAE